MLARRLAVCRRHHPSLRPQNHRSWEASHSRGEDPRWATLQPPKPSPGILPAHGRAKAQIATEVAISRGRRPAMMIILPGVILLREDGRVSWRLPGLYLARPPVGVGVESHRRQPRRERTIYDHRQH